MVKVEQQVVLAERRAELLSAVARPVPSGDSPQP